MNEAKAFAEEWAAEARWRIWGQFDLRYKSNRLRERIIMKIVWALPREIIRWALVRAAAHATMGRWGMEEPSTVTVFKVMDRWEKQ